MKSIAISAVTAIFLSQMLCAQDVKSLKDTEDKNTLVKEVKAELRAGYIKLDPDGFESESAVSLGGHIGFETNRYNGITAGVEFYTVQGMGIQNDNPDKIDGDFFDGQKSGFSILSQAFIDGKWGNTELKIGRQLIDTPHADSDDIRMMPNYFMAYILSNNDIEGLILSIGQITQMAGWENGIDASGFKNISEVLALGRSTDGIYLASALYEGIENSSFEVWFYNIDDVANVLYLEAGYEMKTDIASVTFGIQYDRANDTGERLGGSIDSSTWGISVEASFEDIGITAMAAYNQDNKDNGAFGSFGGGAFFTSLEDQTLDAMEQKGSAWVVGVGYDFANSKIDGLSISAVYGKFEADNLDNYDTDEIDVMMEYDLNENFNMTLAYASIKDNTNGDVGSGDYDQFRLIANYDF